MVRPSSVQVAYYTFYTVSKLYIAAVDIYPGSTTRSVDDHVMSSPIHMSGFPMNSSTGAVHNFTVDTQTVTAHYYYPPRDYTKQRYDLPTVPGVPIDL